MCKVEGRGIFEKIIFITLTYQAVAMDCMGLSDPMNGRVTDNTAYGSQANYTCDPGYCLSGNRYRTCQCGGWTGTEPTCGKQH